jgi:hypothetical protein
MNTHSRRALLVMALTLALGAALATSALASTASQKPAKEAVLVIHHQVRGCHAWSLNGGPFVVKQKLNLARGGFLTLTNNDLMAQELVRVNGPTVTERLLAPFGMSMVMKGEAMGGTAGRYALNHPGARLKVTFTKAGVYHFKLVDRGDYFKNIKTIGPDNKPTLTVVVS